MQEKHKIKLNRLISDYRLGAKNDKEILDTYHEATSDINTREQVGFSLYPNLLKFIEEMAKWKY